MIVNARSAGIQTYRIRIRDKMDLVAARGELETEFSCDDAASAISRVARDSDSHDWKFRMALL